LGTNQVFVPTIARSRFLNPYSLGSGVPQIDCGELQTRRADARSARKKRRIVMGILSDWINGKEEAEKYGMSERQADRDVDRGHAEPRNDAENQAASDYVDEALETGSDPIPSGK
jgi:hypothetical protein